MREGGGQEGGGRDGDPAEAWNREAGIVRGVLALKETGNAAFGARELPAAIAAYEEAIRTLGPTAGSAPLHSNLAAALVGYKPCMTEIYILGTCSIRAHHG